MKKICHCYWTLCCSLEYQYRSCMSTLQVKSTEILQIWQPCMTQNLYACTSLYITYSRILPSLMIIYTLIKLYFECLGIWIHLSLLFYGQTTGFNDLMSVMCYRYGYMLFLLVSQQTKNFKYISRFKFSRSYSVFFLVRASYMLNLTEVQVCQKILAEIMRKGFSGLDSRIFKKISNMFPISSFLTSCIQVVTLHIKYN